MCHDLSQQGKQKITILLPILVIFFREASKTKERKNDRNFYCKRSINILLLFFYVRREKFKTCDRRLFINVGFVQRVSSRWKYAVVWRQKRLKTKSFWPESGRKDHFSVSLFNAHFLVLFSLLGKMVHCDLLWIFPFHSKWENDVCKTVIVS